jgi:peptidyl-prolyl cis-trans isomerase A (cyclophilin A)
MRKLLFSLLGSSLLLSAGNIQAATAPSVVELQTNLGTIAISLDYQHAPISANNFMTYVNGGFYKNTIIHRMIKGFMMQGGGVNKADGVFKAALAAPITLESTNLTGLSNVAGSVTMARTNDPNSATSQFFINFVDNKNLDYADATNPGYAVFGKVVAGMPLVKRIETFVTPTTAFTMLSKLGNKLSLGCSTTASCSTFPEIPFVNATDFVSIDAVYTDDVWDTTVSKTRVSLSGSGSVVSLPVGINCGTKCQLSQTVGSSLKLVAKPAVGYGFSSWTGDCTGISKIISINTSQGNHNCMAIFTKL